MDKEKQKLKQFRKTRQLKTEQKSALKKLLESMGFDVKNASFLNEDSAQVTTKYKYFREATKHIDFSLQAGGVYKSLDGHKIKIWEINRDSVDRPAAGAILMDGVWKSWYWNLKGVAKIPYRQGNDIVAKWSET